MSVYNVYDFFFEISSGSSVCIIKALSVNVNELVNIDKGLTTILPLNICSKLTNNSETIVLIDSSLLFKQSSTEDEFRVLIG